ncbi:MAG TPA: hypothetical protein VIL09_13690 [Microvirga sp.]|jgi:Tol biopolymer transport system component
MFLSVQSIRKPQAGDIIQRLSVSATGTEGRNGSGISSFDQTGRYIVFESESDDLVPNTTFTGANIFLKDALTGATNLVAVTQAGVQASGDSQDPSISANGRYVVFTSYASNLVPGDTNNNNDIFLKDLGTGVLTRVSTRTGEGQVGAPASEGDISADGRYVVFTSYGAFIDGVTPNRYHIYRKDTATGTTQLVSATGAGAEGADVSQEAQISLDGNLVVFQSRANNLVDGDTNGRTDIFLKNMTTGAVSLVSQAAGGANGDSQNAQISANGRFIVFDSAASNLVAGDTNNSIDVFRKDLQTGEVTLVSRSAMSGLADGGSERAQISADGRYVVFQSEASNLAPGQATDVANVFLKDMETGSITVLSQSASGASPNQSSTNARITPDGRYALLESDAGNLVPGDTNTDYDVFRVDLLYKANAQAVLEGRFVEVTLGTGGATQASLAWGDGSLSTATPVNGVASFSHAYASAGLKAATVTLNKGALTWIVPHAVDVSTGSMARNTALADTLSGGAGNDVLTGDAFANVLIGNTGNDRLSSGFGNDTVLGGSGADTLLGDVGNDHLTGGLGRDTMTGGRGRDVFAFDDRETGASTRSADYLTDFSGRQRDRIDLKLVDANTRKRGDQKFTFIGEAEFTGAGQVRYEKVGKQTYISLNTDADLRAEAVIRLKGAMDLSKGWFVL